MAGNIKGITIEFRGDTSKLDQALRKVNNQTKSIDKELKQVDKALKFNPTSIELWRQKQDLLKSKISETKDKLDVLKQAQAKMDAAGVDKNSEEYRKLQREIIVTENQLKNYEGQLRKIGNISLKATSEQFKELGNNLTAAGEAMRGLSMAGAAVAGSIGALTVKSAAWADDLNTMSKVYGINTTELQKYSAAADLVDVSVETIAKSHVKLEKSMYSAKDGSGAMADAFNALGVDIKNSDGTLRNSDDVFQDVIKSLGSMTNETERDAIAQQLMGRSAAQLNPLIEDQGETYKNVADTFAKYNLDFVDQKTLDKANEFNDKLDEMKATGTLSLQILGSKMAELLLPVVTKLADWMGKLAEKISKMNPVVLTIIGVIGGVVAVIAPVLLVLGKIAFAISSITGLLGTLGVSFGAIAGPIGIAIAVIAALIAIGVLLYKNWDTIKAKAAEIKAKLIQAWTQIKTSVIATVNSLKQMVINIWNTIKTTVINVVNGLKAGLINIWNAIKSTIAGVVTGIQSTLTSVWNTIKSVTSAVWNAIKSAISTPINAAKSTVTSVANALKSALSGAWNAIKSTASSVWNGIKNAITSPIQSAKATIQGIMNKIKGFFPLKIGKLINFKIPTISLKTNTKKVLGKEITYPTGFDVSWHKKGGIFTNPTLLADPNGGIHGVGEAGAEAILPISKLQEMVDFGNAQGVAIMEQQTRLLLAIYEELQKEKNFKVDGIWAGRYVNSLVR